MTGPGSAMTREMAEQPAVLDRLIDRLPELADAVRRLTSGGVPGVAFLARGSSDNAALLGRYAVEVCAGLPTCLLAPSVTTTYRRRPAGFTGWLVVALSQSGRTPEIVEVASRHKEAGASVLAITNDRHSDLARVADASFDLEAGPEVAVPATKTVTAEMVALLGLAGALAGAGGDGQAALRNLAAASRVILADDAAAEQAVTRLASSGKAVVVGRGYCYPAALETALKLQETTGILAHGFSTADFRHGPIAVCGPDTPAILLAGSGPADDDTRDLTGDLGRRGGACLVAGTGPGSQVPWPALGHGAEGVLATIRGQQLALALCRARSIDPDAPQGLKKVTPTH